MKKILYTIGLAFTFSLGVMAQQAVSGVVKDSSGKPISGVKVSKVGEFRLNSITDKNGLFSLDLEKGDYIELNYADITLKRVQVNDEILDIVLDSRKDAVVDMGFIKRTEETQTQAVAAIYANLLEKMRLLPTG